MGNILGTWVQWLMVSTAYAVVITLLLSPALLWQYRRRVKRWMGHGAQAPVAMEAEPGAPATVRWLRVTSVDAARNPAWHSGLPAMPGGVWRIVAGYGVAGLAVAVVLTACFAAMYARHASAIVLTTAFLVFLLPLLATVLSLLCLRPATRLAAFFCAGAALYGLLGDRRDLALTLFTTFALVPLLVLGVFGLRFWRGVAPMVLIVSLASSLLAVAMVQYVVKGFGLESAWPWRVAGFAVGAGLGYLAVRGLQTAHEQRRFSDLELFVDGWWLVYLLVQSTIFLVMGQHAGYVGVLASFVPFVILRRLVWKVMAVPGAGRPPRSLLLLRVFAADRRMQALFEGLEARWRHVGPIRMIAGWDLALRNIGPADFVAFLGGRLRQLFVRDSQDLEARLAALDDERDVDGRYRVGHFWCHAHTWQPTMRALAGRSQAVLMDLRGFTRDRDGCRYELLHLARHAPSLPVLLLVDSAKAYDELRALVAGAEHPEARWVVADLASDAMALDDALIAVLQRP